MTRHRIKHVKKNNTWQIASAILGILLVISLYFNMAESQIKDDDTGSPTISLEDAQKKALGVINNNLLRDGMEATVIDTLDKNEMYGLRLDINGQDTMTYLSKDGKFLFTNAIDLDNPPAKPASQPTAPSEPVVVADVSVDDDAVRGSADATVTIIEFSDFECPYCGRFYTNTYSQIKEQYIDTGKVKYVFRDFPLNFHQKAQKASEAAECAGEQNKYWEMHDKLFENQGALDITSLKSHAVAIGLDADTFNTCLDSGKFASEVQKDLKEGQSYGVTGTPAFFINGQFISGAQPFEVFKKAIEDELAK